MTTTFQYRVRDRAGKVHTGEVEASSAELVARNLRDRGLIPLSIDRKRTSGLNQEIRIPGLTNRIKQKDVVIFSRQFATMVNSGLSLLKALAVLVDQTESRGLAEVIVQVKADVEKGTSLSAALERHPKAFSPLYVSMVRAGEIGGVLDETLDRLADILEANLNLRSKVKSALAYPTVVGLLIVAITTTGKIRVTDTQFTLPGVHGHRGTVTAGTIQVGQEAVAAVDAIRRERIRKNHTGTHILHWALREVLGSHVHQAGSLVAPDRLRFDFSHYEALDPEAALAVEEMTNERIIENARVTTVVTSKDEAEKMGALAFFGDKYGDRVRVVRAGDYSTEFCGGTHVPSTGQVGPLVLVSEGSVGSNLRRVEALTGTRAYEYLSDIRRRLERTAEVLHTQPGKVVEAATALAERIRNQEERLAAFEDKERSALAASLLESVEERDGHALVVAEVQGMNADGLRALVFQIRDRLESGIVVVGTNADGKGALVGWVSDDLVDRGVSAGELVAAGAAVLGGGGSRDPRLAQAGGPHGDRIQEALEAARDAARQALVGLG